MIATNLRDEVFTALKSGATRDDLLAIVLQHKERGESQQATYEALQSVWLELGCHENEENRLCETLGDIMDRVWGFCSPHDAIWDTSLPGDSGE